MEMTASGPISGVKVLEFAGIGPGPFAAMTLSDMGADIIRIERPGAKRPTPDQIDLRGRRTISLDWKGPRAIALCLLPQPQLERTRWPEMKQTFAGIFRTKTCDEWCASFSAVPDLPGWGARTFE